jgi:Mrp family chromosome partitioning ATPase
MVLIDTPPLLKVADARVLARYVDDTILVLRAGKTSRAMGAAAYSQLAQDGRSVLGTILNDWNPKMDVPYGYSSRLYQDGYVVPPKSE